VSLNSYDDTGNPTNFQQSNISLSFLGNRQIAISENDVLKGTYLVSEGGTIQLSSDRDLPPYISVILLNLLPAQPITAAVGSNWTNTVPTDALLTNEMITTQDRYRISVVTLTGNDVGLAIQGDVRLIRTLGLLPLIVNPTVQRLLGWTPFLTGTAQFDTSVSAVSAAQWNFMPLPDAIDSYDQVNTHSSRYFARISLKR